MPATGAATATGSLTFGIGTEANNGLGGAAVLMVDPNSGNIVTIYNGQTYANSYIDAGTSVLAFGSNAYPVCVGVGRGSSTVRLQRPKVCRRRCRDPSKVRPLSASASPMAISCLVPGPPSMHSTIWRRPPGETPGLLSPGACLFFFGRSVYTAIEGRVTPGGTGPYVAF